MTTKYFPLPAELYIRNRRKLTELMAPGSLAVLNSNDIYPISADSTLPFAQHRDIFYLSGVDQEESILIIFPEARNPEHREILFVRKTDAHIAVWEGEKLTQQATTEISGVQTVYWLEDFDKIFHPLMLEARAVYLNQNEHYRAVVETQTREDRFIKKLKEKYAGHTWLRLNPLLQHLRGIKEPEEIERIAEACKITEKGFRRLLSFVKPGVWEYEIEAELIHEFVRNRSKGFAYTPIIATGNNANVLHYIANNTQCRAGECILLDVGAEYGNYASDMTRVIPVSGRFTERQKQIYSAVLKMKDEATQLLVPGNNWTDFHKECGKIYTSIFLDLGLLDKADIQNEDPKWPAYKKYMMHGTSHHLGLDTHDYGALYEPFVENMVFTVEPGIYLSEEGLGIRLEDDVVIQSQGAPLNLMKNIPLQIEEIEDLMNK